MDLESNNPAHASLSTPLLKGVAVSNKVWLLIAGFVIFNVIFWPLITVFVILKNTSGSSSSITDDDYVPVPVMTTIFPKNYTATGVRQGSDGNILVTGATGPPTLENSPETHPCLYYGTLEQLYTNDYQSSLYHVVPVFPNETVTASMFYGPNTPYYDPRIGEGNILAVGAYAYAEYPYQCSFIYEGPPSGGGNFTKIIINNRIINGTYVDEVALTVAHSVMGDYVVGNVYYASNQKISYGLIYNRFRGDYMLIERGRSTTLYGIWQNGGYNSTKYTIVGGHSDFDDNNGTSIEVAFIENFDALTKNFTDYRTYYYLNNMSLATHFQGITGAEGGFNLASEVLPEYVPSFAYIPVEADGSFGNATWIPIESISPYQTTSDTVVGDFVFGVYYTTSYTFNGQFRSYVYNVSEALARG